MELLKYNLIVVAGPTAVGKSAYAIKLAKEIDGEIISLDSVQVYKGLDIGSAKITKAEMDGIPHYLIDIVDPNVNFNIKLFKDMAKEHIIDIQKRGKIPILVGGTGFYIHAVLYDCDFLEEDEDTYKKVHTEIYNEYNKNGIDNIYNELMSVDTKSALSIPKNNIKRVIRALEFYKIHGFPISIHNESEHKKKSPYKFLYIVLYADRKILYDRINSRVDKMINDGFLLEVHKLISRGYDKSFNSMKSIGYSELFDYVSQIKKIDDLVLLTDLYKKNENEFSNIKKDILIKFNELINISELIKQHTRNFAKRQLTWFKKEQNTEFINISNIK